NADLISFWPSFNLAAKSQVFVPLCGKSLDMLWLVQQGFKVVGIELSVTAVEQFFAELQMDFQRETINQMVRYYNENITIWVGDIFDLDCPLIYPVDAIYDRAALIALPASLRPLYVKQCLRVLKPGGVILLKTLAYDGEGQGPPYSVTADEVEQLYGAGKTITNLKTTARLLQEQDSLLTGEPLIASDSLWSIT
ncbi:MAG: methyltransferase domain-containing protein, partial [bacterium]|nr:methyltransferase domain-containing protein [bacterium]